jgi:hypothetical protein
MESRSIPLGGISYVGASRPIGMPLPSPASRPFATSTTSMVVEETHKGQWTPHEDDILRQCAQMRNANPTACSASRCRQECGECYCVHHYCTPDTCYHGTCTERDCAQRSHIFQWPRPAGSLVMRPLADTLCRHLTSTDKPWTEIAAEVSSQTGPGKKRNAKQCRERWFQQLRPGLLHQPITDEEGALIMELVERHGNKWADISRDPKLERRSDNWIKNWFNSSGNKKERAKAGMARGTRQGPASPSGIQRSRPQHQHTRSNSTINHIYNYAAEVSSRHTVHSPTYFHSPTYQHASYPFPSQAQPQQSSSSAVYDHWEPNHYPSYTHTAQYHGRRRESTVSVNTASSQAANGSGPSTPSTSVSLTFPTTSKDTRTSPPHIKGGSPKDPRMTIGALCS